MLNSGWLQQIRLDLNWTHYSRIALIALLTQCDIQDQTMLLQTIAH
ncbi:hypothetical protein [Bifidobacterium dolichotidis]|nr:hypothetical protein [Bifidobacterium dolichotidis]